MDRSIGTRLIAALGAATALAACATSVAAQPKPDRPNILFLMADQFRADCLGSAGNAVIRTPNLDRLATEGARFSHAYSSTPSCTPARSALLTGLSPWRHGMLGYGAVAFQYPHEMPRMLREAGYYTLGIGKMHFSPQRNLHGFHKTILDESGREQSPDFRSDYRSWFWSMAPMLNPDATGIGWNDYRAKTYVLPEELHPTRWTADVAVRFLEEYRGSEPFFCMVSFTRPHSPYDPPERFMKMYENADVPAAAIGDWAERNDVQVAPQELSPWRGNLGPEQVRQSRRAYYASVTFIDEQIGRILSVLRERGLLDNTLILFTADHGDMTGDHYLWRKTYAYEASARIPMLVRWPKAMDAGRGQVLGQPAELRDVLPTFLDAAGVAVAEKDFDGRSLLEPIRGQTTKWREFIDLEHSLCYGGSEPWSALTDGRAKYIFYGTSGREELFDLQKDPSELHNLASDAQYADALRTWRDRLIKHLAERGEEYVKDGKLVAPRKNLLYSPNFPKPPETQEAPRKRARAARQAADRPPNFVILFADDLGYGDLGCYGHPTIRTPQLDRMAAEGQRFTDFYVGGPVCSPSRAALMTGRLPIRSGMYGINQRVLFPASTGGLPDSEITIAQALKTKGYATACVGKWHLGHLPKYLPTRHGFDSYFGIPYSNDMKPTPLMRDEKTIEEPAVLETLTARYTEEATRFIRQNPDKPFFLYLAYTFPHVPLRANEKFKGKSPRGLYGDVVEEIDWSVGEVLKTIREAGLAERTLVVFSSDNGPWLVKNQDGGSAGLLRDGKGSTWEGGMREPGIFWWPGTVKPGVHRDMATTMDLLPTFVELAGGTLPSDREYDGRSLAPVLLGRGEGGSRILFYYDNDTLMAVRKGPWKAHLITRAGYGPERKNPVTHDPPMLIHLGQDPSEKYDVAKDHPDVIADLMAEVRKHKAAVKAAPPQYDLR